MQPAQLEPGFGLRFSDFYDTQGLVCLDAAFLGYLADNGPGIHERLLAARAQPESLDEKSLSALLVEAAPYVEDFIAELFHIRAEVAALAARHHRLTPLYTCRRLFVQRQVGKARDPAEVAQLNGETLRAELAPLLGAAPGDSFDELTFAETVLAWMDAPDEHAQALDLARRYTAWVLYSEAGRARHRGSCLFVGQLSVCTDGEN